MRVRKRAIILIGLMCAAMPARAGPPFVTDDPEPVGFQHCEVYLAFQFQHTAGDSSGTLPQVELNYGIVPNVQLHLVAPAAFDAASGHARQSGYGDTEIGAKYRFIQESEYRPQIGVFPLAELPTGSASRGLGGGHTQLFLPGWLQKSRGPWTTYGGGGYWVNPGAGNRNWWLTGWLVQRQVLPSLALGAELVHETAKTARGKPDTKANLGLIWDLSETDHVLASAGPVLMGPAGYQAYLAFQLTLGPRK